MYWLSNMQNTTQTTELKLIVTFNNKLAVLILIKNVKAIDF